MTTNAPRKHEPNMVPLDQAVTAQLPPPPPVRGRTLHYCNIDCHSFLEISSIDPLRSTDPSIFATGSVSTLEQAKLVFHHFDYMKDRITKDSDSLETVRIKMLLQALGYTLAKIQAMDAAHRTAQDEG